MPIPDDISLDAAIYGSSHIPTLLAREDADGVGSVLERRCMEALQGIDADLAMELLTQCPDLVYSDDPLDDPDIPDDVATTALAIRDFVRAYLGSRLVRQWDESIDQRGRLIGLGEHSARRESSGLSEADFKMAYLRQRGGGR